MPKSKRLSLAVSGAIIVSGFIAVVAFQNCSSGFLSQKIASLSSDSLTPSVRMASGGASASIQKGNLTVSLSGTRGGLISSIHVQGLGETIVDDRDGRGMGTSGFPFVELGNENGGVWNEGGCDGGPTVQGGNGLSDVSFEKGSDYILARANSLVNWNVGVPDCRTPDDSPGKHLQVSHKVSFPLAYDGAVRVEELLYNANSSQNLTPSATNTGYAFPIAPQAHFRASLFQNGGQASFWRYRDADGSWKDLPVDRSGGWLRKDAFESHPTGDFYHPAGHAVAIYRDADRSFGVSLYCPTDDAGFWAKDMNEYGILFLGSVWAFQKAITPGETVRRVCHVIYGSETVILASIASLSPAANPAPVVPETQSPQPSPVPAATNAQLLDLLFRGILQRPVTPDAIQFASSLNCVQVGSMVALSPEAQGHYVRQDEATFIRYLYTGVLGREVVDWELRYWLDQRSRVGLTRDQVITNFVESSEFRDRCTNYKVR